MEAAFEHWSASWPLLIGYVVVAASHLAGLRRSLAAAQAVTPEVGTSQERRREAMLFQLGLLLVLVSLVSPVGYYSTVYIWIRMMQTLLVAVVAPGLLVVGAPWESFRAVLTRQPSQPPSGTDIVRRTPWLMSRPALAVIAANVVWLVWEVPALFDAARANAGLAWIEHLSYLAAGTLFWLQMISSRPFSQATPPLRRLRLLIGTVGVSTVFGMMLVFGSSVLYPAYANSAHHLMTVLDDQQLAGAVWWMGMLPAMSVGAVALMMQWLRDEESAELSAGLDRLLTPRRHGWPSRPVIR
ncbi:MAG TPA: cytochrome c oxidase assembly protein [Streptosporangiaceae bacterium]|nr:cytochrome c oxidase assembly protein [Streptosporangiaceae bacterium]